ncbi:MAG: cytochrome C biogenesis protein, partial [Draconibacterium sp.]
MKKLLSFLSSMVFSGILLIIFAVAIGYATFIENSYGTITAKILVYNAKWFEVLLVVLALNLLGSMARYKLLVHKKWTVLLFLFALIIILIG